MGSYHTPLHRNDSAPAAPYHHTMKTNNKFMSVASQLVQNIKNGAWRENFEIRKSAHGACPCPPERMEFYRVFSALVKMGNIDKEMKAFHRSKSTEDQVYQNEVKDLVWLELQAWHSSRTMEEQDHVLYQERQEIPCVLDEIMMYSFNHKLTDQPVIEVRDDNTTSTTTDILGDNVPLGLLLDPSDGKEALADCDGCLDIYCPTCMSNRNFALKEVKNILKKLEKCEGYFQSSKAFGASFPLYSSEGFVSRVKTLCMWYNITRQLRLKISVVSKTLSCLGVDQVIWPQYTVGNSPNQLYWSPLTSKHDFKKEGWSTRTTATNLPETEEETRERKHSKVRFDVKIPDDGEMEDGTAGTSNPSDSVNSSDGSVGSIGKADPNIQDQPKTEKVLMSADFPKLEAYDGTVYRKYVDKLLKSRGGLKRVLDQLRSLLKDTLEKAYLSLEKPKEEISKSARGKTDEEDLTMEFHCFGTWSEEFKKLNLPSFKAPYLFLSRIPLDIMYECLKMRIEQQPSHPSSLTIRQLMTECREALKAAVLVRQKFQRHAQVALIGARPEEIEAEELSLEKYDTVVNEVMEFYLDYLRQLLLQELEPQVGPRYFLEDEWTFVKHITPYVRGGEVKAGIKFCYVACNLLSNIGEYLDEKLEHCTSSLYDSAFTDDPDHVPSIKQPILHCCRQFQTIFHKTRDRAIRAISFAKTLRKDLEIAAEFRLDVSEDDLMRKLEETGHVRVQAPHRKFHLMFVPGYLKDQPRQIVDLLNMTCGHEGAMDFGGDCYLLVLKYSGVTDSWAGEVVEVPPTAETTIVLSRVEIDGLLLVVNHSMQLGAQRRKFEQIMGESITLTKEQRTCNQSISESLEKLKVEALTLRSKIALSIVQVEKTLNLKDVVDLDEQDKFSLIGRCREILHQCYRFGFEYHKELSTLVTGCHKTLAMEIIAFAQQWMNFVKEWCERGRGLRPRWSNPGFNFLIRASEPGTIRYLDAEEFKNFRFAINSCVTHVIGSSEKTGARYRNQSPSPAARSGLPARSNVDSPRMVRSLSAQVTRNEPGICVTPSSFSETGSLTDSPKIHSDDSESPFAMPVFPVDRLRRIRYAVDHLEEMKNNDLMKQGVIGHVTDTVPENRIQIRLKSVTFSWQRGFKIGQGRFGKVFTAVNNKTGELMAMKEIHLQPNDHKAIKNISDELRIFEGIRHKHLVKYYGLEVHREEMLIFMEFCAKGTLENLAASLDGLPEPLIRRYSRQLLDGINTLHEHGIIHRDIKGANIFLTDEGNCLKLGDFGCAVKIKSHTTIPGELNGFVGTQAFMAPEVFMKTHSDGYGRAADIWSLGCVIIEMATGKRPWYELESNYQIMFKVGMGESPEIPSNLSDEGQDIVRKCLKHDPKLRPTAVQLLDHPFVKVVSEDECMSLPTFLRHIPTDPAIITFC